MIAATVEKEQEKPRQGKIWPLTASILEVWPGYGDITVMSPNVIDVMVTCHQMSIDNFWV